MKRKFFLFMDTINTFLIYFSTIITLVTLIAYALSYSNDYSYFVKCIWSWLFNFSVFLLSGSVGYRNMPKYFNKSTKISTILLVIVCYLIAIIFLLLSIISFVRIFFAF